MRSPEVSRLYLQVAPDERIEDWPDERIWDELDARFAPRRRLRCGRGPDDREERDADALVRVGADAAGRLFLAGDAAHIVPPTGAKGLNLAVHDVERLARR